MNINSITDKFITGTSQNPTFVFIAKSNEEGIFALDLIEQEFQERAKYFEEKLKPTQIQELVLFFQSPSGVD